MSRLENIINEIKDCRIGKNRAWIYDENGNLKTDILLIDTLDIIDEISYDMIEWNDELADEIRDNGKYDNTYNWSANITNDIEICECGEYAILSFHKYGDVRAHYTDEIIIKFDNKCFIEYLNELESTRKTFFTEKFDFEVCAFGESVEVWDNDGGYVGTCYETEIEDALKVAESLV